MQKDTEYIFIKIIEEKLPPRIRNVKLGMRGLENSKGTGSEKKFLLCLCSISSAVKRLTEEFTEAYSFRG